MPAYLLDFKCLGPECEDHCCYGWDVIVDRRSYTRYQQLRPNGLGKRLKKAVRLNRKDPSDARYARIIRNGDLCPFLTPDRLCRIHAELGADFLPNTCDLFPRHLRTRDGWIDISASLACPEIARRALENPNGIEIVKATADPEATSLRAIDPPLPHDIEAAGLELQTFTLTLLKDRRHPLWQRLLILGFLLERVSCLSPALGTAAIPSLLSDFGRQLDKGDLIDRIEQTPILTGLQLQMVKRLTDEKMPSVRVKAFTDCVRASLAGLGYSGDQPFTDLIGRQYDRAFDLYYRPFLERYGYMLENYLVSHLLHHALCFHRGSRLYEGYMATVLNFAMLKTYLIGLSAQYRERVDTALATRMIYSFTKAMEPDASFKHYALGLLRQSGCTDMMHMAVLIRN